jgi:tRNA(fMet)-specific endonuclease VapC
MPKSLIDTDIFSEVLKGVDPIVRQRASAYRAVYGFFTISTVTVLEIVKGLHKVGREQRIQQFLQGMVQVETVSLDISSAVLAGRIFADLERTGQPTGRADPMIAAIALQQSLTLVTGNMAHYQRIKALGYPLDIDNWRI